MSEPGRLRIAVSVLRVFLGVTFCYAGALKLASPGFFGTASPASPHATLLAIQPASPLGRC